MMIIHLLQKQIPIVLIKKLIVQKYDDNINNQIDDEI